MGRTSVFPLAYSRKRLTGYAVKGVGESEVMWMGMHYAPSHRLRTIIVFMEYWGTDDVDARQGGYGCVILQHLGVGSQIEYSCYSKLAHLFLACTRPAV